MGNCPPCLLSQAVGVVRTVEKLLCLGRSKKLVYGLKRIVGWPKGLGPQDKPPRALVPTT
jgi:hypothetical protein